MVDLVKIMGEVENEEEDSDGFTPLGLKLKNLVDYEGFNGLAKVFLSTLDAISRVSWDAKNLAEDIRSYVKSEKPFEGLPEYLDGYEE